MERRWIVAPSLLSADMARLGEAVKMVDESAAEWVHLDVMDGVFVENISFGFALVETVAKLTGKVRDVHMMTINPEKWVERLKKAGADVMTVHMEACPHIHRTLEAIRRAGMRAGVALNPGTPPEMAREALELADVLLLMGVDPGFGGQRLIERTVDRVREARAMIDGMNRKVLIEVDGGVNVENANMLGKAGADVLVAGAAVFKSENPKETIEAIRGAR